MSDAVEQERVIVREQLAVHGGRWFNLLCECESCTSDGRPLPELGDVPAVASYVAMGQAVLPGRDELCALFEPLPVAAARHAELSSVIARIREGVFEPTPSDFVCGDCPALDLLCAGPRLALARQLDGA